MAVDARMPFFGRIAFWLTSVMLVAPHCATAADIESVIRFNTTCAQCHEGQCSGRLSFSLGAEAAFDHIRRYAGDVDDATTQALYDALSRMKIGCAFAPLPVPSMQEPVVASELSRYRNPRTGAYFVPVGILQPEQYRLELRLSSPASFRMEIINEFFELVEETCLGPHVQQKVVAFTVDEGARHYVRLVAPSPLHLESMRWIPD